MKVVFKCHQYGYILICSLDNMNDWKKSEIKILKLITMFKN